MRTWSITGLVVAKDGDEKAKKPPVNGELTVEVQAESITQAIQEATECGLDENDIQLARELEAPAETP